MWQGGFGVLGLGVLGAWVEGVYGFVGSCWGPRGGPEGGLDSGFLVRGEGG